MQGGPCRSAHYPPLWAVERDASQPRRVTWHPGGPPHKQMEARFFRDRYSAAGELAYIACASGYNGIFVGGSGWKGYRGGTTPVVQIMNRERDEVTTIPGAGATNFNPFWLDGKVDFLSDRQDDKVFNLYRYDPAEASLERLSDEDRYASIGKLLGTECNHNLRGCHFHFS